MAITYADPQFKFVDSTYGTAATSTGIKVNVPIIQDKRYHRRVQTKNIFKKMGLVGDDTFSEGSVEETAPGFPVIRKTNFNAERGDTIVMHQRTNLGTTNNLGRVNGTQMVDAEAGWDLNYKQVKIEQWRYGVLTAGGMNEQRSPFSESFIQTEMELLSDWSASVIDNAILYAAHYGHAPHLFRAFGHSNLVPAAVANDIYGNDETLTVTRTVADLVGGGSDNLKGITFELADVYCRQNNFDPVKVDGSDYWVCLISPKAALKLLRDTEFRDAMQYAMERGKTNPIFKHAKFLYGNCIIYEYDKIRSLLGGYNPAGLTVANTGAYNSAITEAVYTGIGGGLAYTDLHQMYVFGANAIALAEGRMRMAERIENDYGQLIGRAADNIWGTTRMDWLDATGTASNNQSLLLMVNSLV